MPLFYTRGTDGLPRGWIRRMKRSITTLVPVFNTNRMVRGVRSSVLPAEPPAVRASCRPTT